jgi:hypothetical protein
VINRGFYGIIQKDCFKRNPGAVAMLAIRYPFRNYLKKNYPDTHGDVSSGVKGMLSLDCLPLWGERGLPS